jgi:pimeloyl-ACP methyl ester carboxylesterase
MTERIVTTLASGDSVRVAYTAWGDGAPVVLVHGMGSWRRIWELPALPGIRFWALDLPGFGESDLPRHRQTFADYVAALMGAVRALHLKRPVLVGHSFGAMVVTAAAAGGLATKGVVLVSPAGFVPPHHALEPTPFYWVNRLLIWITGMDWFGVRMAQGLGLVPERLSRDTRAELRDGWRRAREMARMGPFYRYPAMGDDARRLQASGTPIRILAGDRDPLFPVARLAPAVEGLSVEWVSGIGHVPMLQDRERFLGWFRTTLHALQRGESPA